MRTTTDPALAAYLRRLGYDEPPAPTLEHLKALHRAHLARLPYDNLDIQLGAPPEVDPSATVARIADGGRVGYCFHQNGALEVLLASLGYAVTRRHGHVSPTDSKPNGGLNHLVLVVSKLPTEENPGGHWWVDVGLGDGFAEPLPLMRGEHEEAGFRYEIGAAFGTQARGRPHGPAAWTFKHQPAGSFHGIVVTERPADRAAVAAAHTVLSTNPQSGFVKLIAVLRRDATGVDILRGCVLSRVQADGTTARDVTAYPEWRAALADGLRLSLRGVDDDALRALWERTRAKHEAWTAAGRP